ncbi:hypothetical protein GCM10010123_06580 [Pilimelia anulata]|uniref:YdhG-like domain-containing protein n=1 Tax=Pilimelia anulata TaxID=53371 RepID=A0A8J3AZH5_9ACTN|nr:DUF1801 domain-containing protein [Pilimelia anulata]GGJ79296.1 hypothetical protein GCM10010123_06580 [Pilimelia anulata]
MGEAKTVPTGASVEEFLAAVADPRRRAEAVAVCALMAEVTGAEPRMWGPGIVGFGAYRYRYASGREGDWPAVGFAPRKQALTLYLADGLDAHRELLARLGPHTTGRSCLYLKRLAAVDDAVLRELVATSFRHLDGTTITT